LIDTKVDSVDKMDEKNFNYFKNRKRDKSCSAREIFTYMRNCNTTMSVFINILTINNRWFQIQLKCIIQYISINTEFKYSKDEIKIKDLV
jgi:hypothetical protein